MPIISMFFGIIIRLFFKEHNPPHIHAEYGDDTASFEIESGEVMVGGLPLRQTRYVQAWIEIHRDELIANWKISQEEGKTFMIDPLK